ncbi:hypothetical protein Hdeb2414_s0008g00280091 [Helianthus debilis subsp. tardiflorus]
MINVNCINENVFTRNMEMTDGQKVVGAFLNVNVPTGQLARIIANKVFVAVLSRMLHTQDNIVQIIELLTVPILSPLVKIIKKCYSLCVANIYRSRDRRRTPVLSFRLTSYSCSYMRVV